jgi:hypothetical protein
MILEFFTPGIASMLANAGAGLVWFDMELCRCNISLVAGNDRLAERVFSLECRMLVSYRSHAFVTLAHKV